MSKPKVTQWKDSLFKKLFRETIRLIKKISKNKAKKRPNKEHGAYAQKIHPWRMCSVGEHWVTDHSLWIPATKERPGYYTTREGHCAINPIRGKSKIVQDYLTSAEMQMMAEKYFANLSGAPASGKLPEYAIGADNFDRFIRGWTKYWNDVLEPDIPLDPDLVKALIATESDFRLKPPSQNAGVAGGAHGLIQLTDQTIKALGDPGGELSNHLVKISLDDTFDPNLSIGASIRWLFRKRDLASRRLKRKATWREAVAEYKSYLPAMVNGKDSEPQQMKKFDDIYTRLKQ